MDAIILVFFFFFKAELVFLFYGLKKWTPKCTKKYKNFTHLISKSDIAGITNESKTMLGANHPTTGFGHHQASGKSILPSHLKKDGNHCFKGDKVSILSQCAKSCGRHWQYSNDQSKHILCLCGAGSLFMEQAWRRHYTKEDEIVNLIRAIK